VLPLDEPVPATEPTKVTVTVTVVPSTLFCIVCEDWTLVDDDSAFGPHCCNCGDVFMCDGCGYEIDRAGHCQRPEGAC
jgi:hypothetical protein